MHIASTHHSRKPRILLGALLAACATLLASPASAWVDKPLKIIVPAPPGGTIDVAARIFVDQLSAEIGQPVIVENKPGAGGAIGISAMLAAPADGQTILMTASNTLTEIPHVLKGNFDPIKDLRPVASIGIASLVLVSAPTLPAQDFNGLVGYLKARPGKLSFATYSAGTVSQYAGEILNQKVGLDLTHVPFAGSPPALQQVMGGQIAIMFDGMVTSLPQINGGKLRAYAVAGKTRSVFLPKVPTMAELGYPEMDYAGWIGVVVSAKMSEDLINKINATMNKLAANPKIAERLRSSGFDPSPALTPAQMSQWVKSDYDRYGVIVKTFNIKLN